MKNVTVSGNRASAEGHCAAQGLVSIVVPCYRGERYLRDALRSCLSQTYSPLEVVVVDDASPDECLAIARELAESDPRIRIVERPVNGGVARAFNDGFAAARGEFLTRLAQDDILEPFAIENMVQGLRTAVRGTGLVYCDQTIINESGEFIGQVTFPPPKNALRYLNRVGVCVMFTRNVWETIGGFSPEYDAAEDYEYWTRVASRFEIVKVDGPPALRFREHEQMGSAIFAEKQIANHFKIVESLSARQFGFLRHWPERQARLCLAHLTAAFACDGLQFRVRALVHLARSFCNWPFPLPSAAIVGKPSLWRLRILVSLLLKFFRSRRTRAAIAVTSPNSRSSSQIQHRALHQLSG